MNENPLEIVSSINQDHLYNIPGPDYFASAPEGIYSAVYAGAEGYMYFSHPKIALWYKLLDTDLGENAMVCRRYNVYLLDPKPRGKQRIPNPSFQVSWKYDLPLEMARLLPGRYMPFHLPHSIPDDFGEITAKVKVGLSKTDRDRVEKPEGWQESQIVKILGISNYKR